jgi:hypothetical protein
VLFAGTFTVSDRVLSIVALALQVARLIDSLPTEAMTKKIAATVVGLIVILWFV